MTSFRNFNLIPKTWNNSKRLIFNSGCAENKQKFDEKESLIILQSNEAMRLIFSTNKMWNKDNRCLILFCQTLFVR